MNKNNKRNHLSFIEELILTSDTIRTPRNMELLSNNALISIPFYINNKSLFCGTYKIELNPQFDMKFFNEIEKFHNIDFFLLSMNRAITLDILYKYKDLPWNAIGLYLNPNFRDTELGNKIKTDVSLLFEDFPNLTYEYDDYTTFVSDPEDFVFYFECNTPYFNILDGICMIKTIYETHNVHISEQDLYPDTYYSNIFRSKYENVLYELDEIQSIPPNVDSRPLFSKGGSNYWNGWEEISSLNQIICK